MCGINGIFLKTAGRCVERRNITAMRETQYHRGPDESGEYVFQNVGLGHQRLSIIGISDGQQPMSNADGTMFIVYNGETYNYKELRQSLQARGHRFRTGSDTEVVLALYAEYGPDCVSHMNGLFAFAIWDVTSKSLFIARDRLGIKPLYYKDDADSFVFASEIKALLKSGLCASEINRESVSEYFTFRAVCGEQTMFSGVRSLLPGHTMLISANKSTVTRYWSAGAAPTDSRQRTPGEAAEELEYLLIDSVKIRLMSEVPLGTFCSGGVDSSLVTAIAAKSGNSAINTFSVGFDDPAYDESEFAQAVADQYGTMHHELRVSPSEFADLVPELVRVNDEPLNFANSVQIYAVSKLAREYVTVVLTGEGADELFLGYPRYFLPVLVERIRFLSPLLRPALGAATKLTADHRPAKLLRYLKMPVADHVFLNSATGLPGDISEVLDASLPGVGGYRRELTSELGTHPDILRQLSVYDQHTYLVSILNRQDKMSMAASIEARVPFLDYRIAEFANSLDSKSRTSGFKTKDIVKKVAERFLPETVVHRRKSGFGVPLASYFRDQNALGAVARRVIHETDMSGLLNREQVVRRYNEHDSGKADHSEMLWTIINFLIWKEAYDL